MKNPNTKSPDLENQQIADGFQVDDTYFEELESVILERFEVESTYDNAGGDGMQAQDGYLEGLENQIIYKLEPKSKKTRVISWVHHHWYAAAGILLVLGIAAMLHGINNTTTLSIQQLDHSYEALSSAYVEKNIYFFNEAEMEFLLEGELHKLDDNIKISDEVLEEYLMVNEVYNMK